MKICIFTHTHPRFPGDTAAPFMGILSEALAKLGHQVYVLMPYDLQIKRMKRPFKLVAYKYIFPKRLHTLGYSRTLQDDKSMGIFAYLLSPFLYFFGFLALLKLVHKEKIDVISSHWIIPNGFIAAIVSKLTGVAFTTTIPGSDVYMGGKNFFFRWMVGFAANSANYVLSDSNHYLKQLNDLGFFPQKKYVIRYGVDKNKFKPTRKDKTILKKLGLNQTAPVILAAGRMVAKKGFIYLIKAMPEVVKKIPKVKLVMIGDGDQRPILEREIAKLGVAGNVIFAGTISYAELAKYYNLADVFVMPSIRDEKGNIDASPVTMMEAMMCGTAVVATRFAGSDDVVAKGETGFLIKEKNSRQIAAGIIKLFAQGDLKVMKKKVRKVAEANFSSESVARKYLKVFKEII